MSDRPLLADAQLGRPVNLSRLSPLNSNAVFLFNLDLIQRPYSKIPRKIFTDPNLVIQISMGSL